jgi:hypothetical protein
MSTRASAGNLAQALKDLSIEWEQTKSAWRDIKSDEFERRYLDPLPHEVTRAVSVIEELDALLRKVKQDCE